MADHWLRCAQTTAVRPAPRARAPAASEEAERPVFAPVRPCMQYISSLLPAAASLHTVQNQVQQSYSIKKACTSSGADCAAKSCACQIADASSCNTKERRSCNVHPLQRYGHTQACLRITYMPHAAHLYAMLVLRGCCLVWHNLWLCQHPLRLQSAAACRQVSCDVAIISAASAVRSSCIKAA